MRKTTLTLLATLIAMLGLFGVAYATHIFPDVEDDNTHAENIYWAEDNGVVVGYEDGNFGPDDFIKRDQAASMFKRYHDAFAPRDGEDGATGPAGPTGPQGEPGADGEDGQTPAYTAKPATQTITIAPGAMGTATATCNEGFSAIGGGYELDPSTRLSDVTVVQDQPGGTYDGMFDNWTVVISNEGTVDVTVEPVVICAKVTSPAS